MTPHDHVIDFKPRLARKKAAKAAPAGGWPMTRHAVILIAVLFATVTMASGCGGEERRDKTRSSPSAATKTTDASKDAEPITLSAAENLRVCRSDDDERTLGAIYREHGRTYDPETQDQLIGCVDSISPNPAPLKLTAIEQNRLCKSKDIEATMADIYREHKRTYDPQVQGFRLACLVPAHE